MLDINPQLRPSVFREFWTVRAYCVSPFEDASRQILDMHFYTRLQTTINNPGVVVHSELPFLLLVFLQSRHVSMYWWCSWFCLKVMKNRDSSSICHKTQRTIAGRVMYTPFVQNANPKADNSIAEPINPTP
jgi:hypothetical protein